ncbi:hypothetical protein PCC7424_1062 [Gloeothece citriformis PCC 7424]|uniref:Uncharacterized protein n=1 Tax=Gloeothece citriformis (strain PCC 7424) TaxID=65393 RepID=B7KJR7_GLOC7|nr:hypothetical protein [Gloeothece citriformis]ACK69516.1 hypothetical protein PCC7424_1062 [Gloeothece citriformis PCC 7424]
MSNQKQLIAVAYPEIKSESNNPESYYLLRLSSLWGEEIVNEYMGAMTEEIATKSEPMSLTFNSFLESTAA